jgi:pimeloyl-ACP methyl ester carboxylesterase
VIVPDLPGFGKTKIDKVYDVDDYAEVVEKFANKLELSNIFLLGHSNGGRISILLENRENIDIQKLFLNNAAGIKHPASCKQKIAKLMAKILKKLSWMPGYNFFRKVVYKLIGGHDYLNVKNEKIKQTFLNMIKSDLKKNIAEIKKNTVLIWGKNDTYTPVGDGILMHKLIDNSKLEILDNERHGIHLQNPNRLFSVIQKYL